MSRLAEPVRTKALALIERVLRQGGPIAGEYPLCFDPRFPGRVLATELDGEVVSACAVLVRDLVAGPHSIRCGLIGSVCTLPERRGEGHASELLRRAERELAQEGCAVAMLWADDPLFYDERGWRPIGAEIDFALESGHESRLGGAAGIRAAAPDDRAAIHRLYLQHRERCERSREETAALLAGPGIETLVLQRSRDVVAYSCSGRGADFASTVHEWAGSDSDVLALVREHMQRARRRGATTPTYLITPPTARSLHDRLRGLGLAWTEGVLAQGKLLDPHAAAALLAAALGPAARVGVESEIPRASPGDGDAPAVTVEGPRGRCELAGNDLLDLLAPARGRRARIEALERECGLELAALPLPLFAWGLDSI
jgi:GNAT superfamily N-acetyltransferase